MQNEMWNPLLKGREKGSHIQSFFLFSSISLSTSHSVLYLLSGGSDAKEFACSAGDLGSIPGSGRFPRERMATHFSILAWRIPWTEEPGRLQSMGPQRVRFVICYS